MKIKAFFTFLKASLVLAHLFLGGCGGASSESGAASPYQGTYVGTRTTVFRDWQNFDGSDPQESPDSFSVSSGGALIVTNTQCDRGESPKYSWQGNELRYSLEGTCKINSTTCRLSYQAVYRFTLTSADYTSNFTYDCENGANFWGETTGAFKKKF